MMNDARTFNEKAADVLSRTDAYKCLFRLNEHNGGQHWSDEVKEMIESMNAALEILKRKKALPVDVIETLLTNHAKVQLPRLCFLPAISKVSHPCLFVCRYILRSLMSLGAGAIVDSTHGHASQRNVQDRQLCSPAAPTARQQDSTRDHVP